MENETPEVEQAEQIEQQLESTEATEQSEPESQIAAGQPVAPLAATKRTKNKVAKKAAAAKATKKADEAKPGRTLVHATLAKRQIRVVFKLGKQVVATSPTYHSGNTLENIINYARRTVDGARKDGIKAIAEVLDGKRFVRATE